MAFKQIGSLNPHGAPVLRQIIITDDVVSTAMDSIKLVSGFGSLGTAGVLVFGHLTAHVRSDGVGVESTGAAGAASGSYVGTFTASATNEATENVAAVCDISKATLYSAEVDATIGTTTGSDLAGYYMDLIDEDTLDESDAATTTGQYATHGLDPNNSAQAVVNVYESSVFGV
jgi:hypothetical protein